MNDAQATAPESTAAAPPRLSLEWGRAQSPADWALAAGVALVLAWLALRLYRRDVAALSAPWRVGLVALRWAALAGVLLVYLQPQWRVERELTRPSRVAVLVDTSLSMGLQDAAANDATSSPLARAEQIAARFEQSPLLPRLRQRHEVYVAAFDESLRQVALLDQTPSTTAQAPPAPPDAEPPVDWRQALAPRGAQTRLGEGLQTTLEQQAGASLSAVVVLSDGNQNAGVGTAAAIRAARRAKVPIHVIGVGSDDKPRNVRASQLVGPARAFPGDTYTVTGYVQAEGLAGQQATVELRSRPADQTGAAAEVLEGTQTLLLGADGEVIPVRFDLAPRETGLRTLQFRVATAQPDQHPGDDQQQIDVEIVDRKTTVMLVAGGPGREYQFLRNLLARDKETLTDVWVQSSHGAVSQEARQILAGFPDSAEALGQYDAIVAIDPDWSQLRPEQAALLEAWVSDQAGGLIAIGGPVHAGHWSQIAELSKLRALYPIEFSRQWSPGEEAAAAAEQPTPLEFTRDGLQAEFLWLGDNAADSQANWRRFPGVYSCYPVADVKSAATVLARFGGRAGAAGESLPYWVSQFYGAGRVFFAGSAEMWRLRRVDESYFEQFYTKLIRHVSQGRLARGSQRGILLLERERYLIGQNVVVQAQLKDARLEPLESDEVALLATAPDGVHQNVTLSADASLPGVFRGQFLARQEGLYRLALEIPDSDGQTLTKRVHVEVPDLERQSPQRNDALLRELADSTGGTYYVGLSAAIEDPAESPLAEQLADRTQRLLLAGAPAPLWDNAWVLGGLCGLLCLEWLLRRLAKLA